MIDAILGNIQDNRKKIKTESLLNDKKVLLESFLKSSPYAFSVFLRHPDLIEVFCDLAEKKNSDASDKPILTDQNLDTFNKYESSAEWKKSLLKKYPEIIDCDNPEFLFFRLRQIKEIEMSIIALKDFFGINSVKEGTREISYLADFCMNYAIEGAFLKLNDTKNLTLSLIKKNVIILGMGKLGGEELNFSSDIDLILFANDDFLKSEEIISKLIQFIKYFLDFLRKSSSSGFLYRVDLRLRPEGSIGPVIMGIKQAVEYYKKRGRNWEFQALIKSRVIWGNENIYDEFFSQIVHLIYSHTPAESILEGVKNIKDKIEDKLKNNLKQINIKLSPGGIRDIEFIIQFMQLVHGVRYKEIRKKNSLDALDVLRAFKIMTDNEHEILKKNYIMLRKIENILQFSNNLSVQLLPEDSNELYRIFYPWNLFEIENKNSDEYSDILLLEVTNGMRKVRSMFIRLFDETIDYMNLKDLLVEKYPEISMKLIDNHFSRMDSEYFLRFNVDEIAKHIMMIERLNKEKLSDISIEGLDNDEWKLTIVAFDYTYEFSKIAGLISSNFFEVLEGESFTYCNYNENKSNNNQDRVFYRRLNKRIYYGNSSINDEQSLLKKRKIVCYTRVRISDKNRSPDWEKFSVELNYILDLLERDKQKEASDKINVKILEVLAEHYKDRVPTISPVEINVDNNSSNLYTILLIKSKNSFAFLYTLTNVLAMRNYYIFKVEISTIDDTAVDRLFIMTRDGHKITSGKKIRELEISIMMIKQYTTLLYNAVDPNKALKYFDELLSRIFESEEKKELPILGQKDVLEKLAKVFGISDFIWEDLFRFNYQTMLPIMDDEIIAKEYDKNDLISLFKKKYCGDRDINSIELADFTLLINKFKDEEAFRIDLRQILKKIDFWDFANELTYLAESIIELAFYRIENHLIDKYKYSVVPSWAIFGLGKLGGKELGFASDIELMFIYDIPESFEDKLEVMDYFEEMIRLFLKTIKTKREGIFEIDLNLRPYGKKGSLAVSLNNFIKYFSKEGEAYFFEKQALIKMRFLTSNKSGIYLENKVINSRDNFVYSDAEIDFDSLYKVRYMQLENYLNNRLNIKYSKGGLVDIEYIVQLFQLKYGDKNKSIRSTSTLDALSALLDANVIDKKICDDLKESYIFYRNLINILRMVKGNSKDLTINYENEIEFEYLVKRSHFIGIIDKPSKKLLVDKINNSLTNMSDYFKNLFSLLS